jgi:tripartite-type tricarboxylate transporter receptor subunit TctC
MRSAWSERHGKCRQVRNGLKDASFPPDQEETMIQRRQALLGALAVGAVAAPAAAQTFPSQPVHIVVPFPPGGGTDALARAIQEPFQKAIGQTVVIDNRGGGGGSIGHEIVAKAAPDGYTVGFSSNNQMLLPYLIARLSFDPATFVPIGGHPGALQGDTTECVRCAGEAA